MLAARIREVTALAAGTDLSLATRRLMDLCDEFPAFQDLRGAAMQLRADYNMGRELGAAEISGTSGSALAERCRQLATAIGQRSAVAGEAGPAPTSEVVFRARQLTKTFRSGGHHFELGPIDLELRTGRIVGVVGENGNGKTTLLRQIAGLLDHDGGSLLHPHVGTGPYLIRRTIAWIPQRSVRWQGTLLQNLRFQAAVHGTLGAANEDRVLYTLHRLGLTRFKDLTWKQLSSGYKLRFELAKMLVWRPKLLVLDEPIANLDLQAQQLFLQDLKHLAGSQRDPVAVILSSQQLHEIEAVADDIMFLKNGKAVYSGAADSFDRDRTSNVYELRGPFTRAQLEQALGEGGILHIDDTGLIFRLTTPRTLGAQHVLKAIANADIEVSYFRDISTSTRKLFHQDP
ncbi:MAG TPA: ABC transporter ATP-binding protein [Flavobacteriales bacterium]|nr:ABC transporter ATP-binding protein [Flavobacteriales bacterium]